MLPASSNPRRRPPRHGRRACWTSSSRRRAPRSARRSSRSCCSAAPPRTGSAPTSDVNVVVVLSAFELRGIERLRPTLERAHAAIRLEVLWLLEPEVTRRRRGLRGEVHRHRAPPSGAARPGSVRRAGRLAPATIARLRQVLLNQLLRLRATYAVDGGREERLALRIADAAARCGSAPPRSSSSKAARCWRRATRSRALTDDWDSPDARRGARGDQRGARDAPPRAGTGGRRVPARRRRARELPPSTGGAALVTRPW